MSTRDPSLFAKRKRANAFGLTFSITAMLIGMAFYCGFLQFSFGMGLPRLVPPYFLQVHLLLEPMEVV